MYEYIFKQKKGFLQEDRFLIDLDEKSEIIHIGVKASLPGVRILLDKEEFKIENLKLLEFNNIKLTSSLEVLSEHKDYQEDFNPFIFIECIVKKDKKEAQENGE